MFTLTVVPDIYNLIFSCQSTYISHTISHTHTHTHTHTYSLSLSLSPSPHYTAYIPTTVLSSIKALIFVLKRNHFWIAAYWNFTNLLAGLYIARIVSCTFEMIDSKKCQNIHAKYKVFSYFIQRKRWKGLKAAYS